MKIVILDYKVGNLKSVVQAFDFLGYPSIVSDSNNDIESADLLILPGQGAFGSAIEALKRSELIPALKLHLDAEKPFLGICVGFQILFEGSEEMGGHAGLGLYPGIFKAFPQSTLKVPHMGWNTLNYKQDLHKTQSNQTFQPDMYFVHSYYLDTTETGIISTTSHYGVDFVSMIQAPNLLATQFHPEKSGQLGLTLLRNFLISINLSKPLSL